MLKTAKPNLRCRAICLATSIAFSLFGPSVAAADGCDVTPAPGVDMRACFLNKRDLSNLDLSGADFRKAQMITTNLNGANLTGAFMVKAMIGKMNITGAQLDGLELCPKVGDGVVRRQFDFV